MRTIPFFWTQRSLLFSANQLFGSTFILNEIVRVIDGSVRGKVHANNCEISSKYTSSLIGFRGQAAAVVSMKMKACALPMPWILGGWISVQGTTTSARNKRRDDEPHN